MKAMTLKSCAVFFLALVMAAGLCGWTLAEGTMPLTGEWAFEYEPETPVLKAGTDGNVWYKGKDWRCEDHETFLLLTDAEGNMMNLRYTAAEDQIVIYPQTRYHRGKEVEGQGGLIGIWEGTDDGSSFVFTPAGYFLEDSAFSGNFTNNVEEGTFLLHYGDVFADTLCYYTITDDILTVEYPWKLVPLGTAAK